jgi:hypothetical protein
VEKGFVPPLGLSGFKRLRASILLMDSWDWGRIGPELSRFLIDRLTLFHEVTDTFGFEDEDLGLGSVPSLHFPNSWMKVIPLKRPHRFRINAPPRKVALDYDRKIVIVESEEALLSVYPKPTSIGDDMMEGFEWRFLEMGDDALVGGYAHECAAYQIYRSNVPERFHTIIRGIEDRQRKEDALAAAYGYRDELVSFFDTHLRLLVYEPKPGHGWFIRGSLSIEEELRDRIESLRRFKS